MTGPTLKAAPHQHSFPNSSYHKTDSTKNPRGSHNSLNKLTQQSGAKKIHLTPPQFNIEPENDLVGGFNPFEKY